MFGGQLQDDAMWNTKGKKSSIPFGGQDSKKLQLKTQKDEVQVRLTVIFLLHFCVALLLLLST